MKSNKAPGITQITSDMLKADPELSAAVLHSLFGKIWNTASFPKDWMQGIIVKVPKKGDLTLCDNWRGIMLLCVTLKVLCKVILDRIKDKIEATLRRQQAGFRSQKSCIDHIATPRIIIEQISEMHESLYLVFVDYEKAFDRLKHEYIWCALQRKGVPDNIVALIKAQYEAFECRISHDGILSDAIQTDAGVRQGCIMSPLLFLVVIDEILTTSIDNAGKRGMLWQPISMEHLEDLDFADDIVLFSQRKSDMQSKLNDLVKHSSAAGLKINAKKTKHLAVHTNDAFYNIGEENIENVNVFQYLGSQFTAESGCKNDVSARLQKARGAFANLRTVWQSKQMHITTKTRIFNSNVKSVLLYACET